MITTNQKLTVFSGILNHIGASCAVIMFLLISFTSVAQICTPSFSYSVDPITYVHFDSIQNTSDVFSNDAYEDFTDQTTQVIPGETYQISSKGFTGGNYINYFTVFIDWNQNGVLDDAGEVYPIGSIKNSNGIDHKITFGNIAVPLDATSGSTRMRVLKTYLAYPTDPCGSYLYGQAEDYTLVVTSFATWDCPDLEANIGDACNDGDHATENDVISDDCECVGIIVFDCPDLVANLGDACDDSDENTENDVVIENCECVGTSIAVEFDCSDLEANIGDDCDDGDPNTNNDFVGEDCLCAGILEVVPGATCQSPISIPTLPYTTTDNTSNYGNDYLSTDRPPMDPNGYFDGLASPSFLNGNDAVYSFTPEEDIIVNITLSGIHVRAGLWLFTGCPFSSTLGYHNHSSLPYRAIKKAELQAGTTYYIVISTSPQPLTTPYTLNVDLVDCPSLGLNINDPCDDNDPATGNDVVNSDCICQGIPGPTCEAPILIPSLPFSNTGHTSAYGDNYTVYDVPKFSPDINTQMYFSNFILGNEIVFAYTPESDSIINIGLIAPEHWTGLWVFTGCPFDSVVTYNHSYLTGLREISGLSVYEGVTYYIVISSTDQNQSVPYTLTINSFSCPDIESNIGDSCDDGNPDTENDVINADCECVGTPIEVDYDCSDLEANIGNVCNLEDGQIGLINSDCVCTVVVAPLCTSVYYLSDHDASNGITDIYEVSFIDGIATMHYIASSDIEVHIAYRAGHHSIYAVSKHENSYRILDVATLVWSAEVSLGGDYGELTAAVFNHDEKLLIGSQTHKAIYVVNVNTNVVSTYDSYVPLIGGDLAYGSDGMLYMATRSGNGLYRVWSAPMPDDLIGILPSKVTGMAITDTDQLLISAQGNTSLVLYDTDGSNTMDSFDLMLNGEPFTLRDGDMASGCMDNWEPGEGCLDFTTLLANHGAGISGSDIYTVKFFGGNAHLTFLTNVNYEAHIAFDAESNTLYLVNVDGSFVSAYDVGLTSFGGDLPIIGDFTKLTAAVFNPYDGLLYVGDHSKNEIHTIDLYNGISTYYGDAPVSGGDLGILDNGNLYLGTKQGSALYEIVAGGPAVMVGSMVPNVTGMARYNGEVDNLIISNNGATVLTKIDATDGSTIETYPIMLGGVPFTLTDGDMAAGCADIVSPLPPINPFVGVESQATLTSYPNPTYGPSKVVFVTAETTRTLIEVYDMNGRKVEILFNQEAQQGKEYTLDFNGSKLSNGVYIYRMTTNHETIIEKFMIAR